MPRGAEGSGVPGPTDEVPCCQVVGQQKDLGPLAIADCADVSDLDRVRQHLVPLGWLHHAQVRPRLHDHGWVETDAIGVDVGAVWQVQAGWRETHTHALA